MPQTKQDKLDASKRCRENTLKKNQDRLHILNSQEYLSTKQICRKCGIEKTFYDFRQDLSRSSGYQTYCKDCLNRKARIQYKEDPSKLERQQVYRQQKPDIYRQAALKYYHSNKDLCKKRHKAWRDDNVAELNAKAKAYKLRKKGSIPPWANLDEIKKIYKYARDWTILTGIPQSVDHIIPLKGETVCGLHVETNLRIIPWVENVSKKNKFDPKTFE